MTDHLEILRQHNAWRRGDDSPMADPKALGIAIEAVIAEMTMLREIEKAARKMVEVKGRHHSELAMKRLIEVCK